MDLSIETTHFPGLNIVQRRPFVFVFTVLITITAVLIFKVIDVTFRTSIKTVDQKSAGLAVSFDQDFHNKKFQEKRYATLYGSGTHAACVACGRWGDILKQMNEGCPRTHRCWNFH